MKLTPQQTAWLKRGEMFVLGIVAPVVFARVKASGLPHDKAGWSSFGVWAGGIVYGAVRLYLAQSPLTEASAQG